MLWSSLEAPHWGAYNEYPQHVFKERIIKISEYLSYLPQRLPIFAMCLQNHWILLNIWIQGTALIRLCYCSGWLESVYFAYIQRHMKQFIWSEDRLSHTQKSVATDRQKPFSICILCTFLLMLSMLGKNFSRWQFEIFLFFPEKRLWQFMQMVSWGDHLHGMSKPIFPEKLEKYHRFVICWISQ